MNQFSVEKLLDDCKTSCSDHKSLYLLKDQKILITGGSGFIGKWICEMVSYLNYNYNLNISLYLIGRDKEAFIREVPHLLKNNFLIFIEQDVRNLRDLPNDVNFVIHAAASPDSRDHVNQPIRTVETIYKGTNLILDYCYRLTNLKKIIHISSSQVYGKTGYDQQIKEDMFVGFDPNKFSNLYGEAKRISETICSIHRNQNSLPIVICRPFSLIGPYQYLDKPWALNNFIRDAIIGGPIRILGDEKVIRTYLYGSDLAYWILSLLIHGKVGESYNIGSTEEITLRELAEKINKLFNNKIDIQNKSSKNSYLNSFKFVPDISKIQKDLNVNLRINIDSALKKTINWHLNRPI